MQKLWIYISNLGATEDESILSRKTIILTNQINFVMFSSMLFLLLTILVLHVFSGYTASFGTLRVVNLLLINVLNLAMARFGYTRLSKLSLIYLPPVVFLLGPTLIGYVEEEGYTYYPYVLICVSIIPQLLLNPKKEKFQYWFALAYYFILVIVIDKLMVEFDTTSKEEFGPGGYPIVERIIIFYPFYKIAQVGIFLFTNATIFYLRMQNFNFENELTTKNLMLGQQNNELIAQKDEIERQKDELINKEISTWQKLINIISHEIVNSAIPITNLAGMSAQMLEDEAGMVQKPEQISKNEAEDVHHSLRIIESRTQGLISFVKATKSLTDIPKPILRKIIVSDLIDRVSTLFNFKFKELAVKFKSEVYPPELCIEADLELIEQVLINLIKNALEAMEDTDEPALFVKAFRNESGHVIISIKDNGSGISEELLERIFLPYYSTKTGSSGIGLSLSQQIMMLHNARLEVSSSVAKGATFDMIF
jgi:signal transduction histidine kinase